MAQRSAHPARQLAPREELHLEARPDLRRDQHPDQHLEAARHAPVRPALSELRLREASLVPCFLPQEAWPPELAQVVPVVRLAGAVHLHQAGCLFGAYPQAASARLGQSEQQARSSPPEVSAEACVRVVPRSEESAVAQPLVERLWAVPASDAAAARQQAAEVAASDAAVGAEEAAEAAVVEVAAEAEEAVAVAVLEAAAGPQQVAVAAVPVVAAEPRPGRCWMRRCCCGRRRACRRRRRRGFPRLSVGADIFLGLRHDERGGLRMRCGDRKLRHRQSGRGKQHDAKVCHDVLGSRKILGSEGVAFTEHSAGRSTANH